MNSPHKIPAPEFLQPKRFVFGTQAKNLIPDILRRYPDQHQHSAVMPLLTLAQEQNGGWLPRAAMDYVAEFLDMPRMRVYEVASFYSMYNLRPVGRQHVEVCTTTPCWLRGSGEIMERCQNVLGLDVGAVSNDGAFGLNAVECLGACVNAPVVKINQDYYEDLTPDGIEEILRGFEHGAPVDPGPQSARHSSEPLKTPRKKTTASQSTTAKNSGRRR